MIGLLQRVTHAEVIVDSVTIGAIKHGLMVLVGVEKPDTKEQAQRLVHRLLGYRVFADEHGKMNCSLQDINGELLLVPQFTLAAETQKGMRPSFSRAAPPELGKLLFENVVEIAKLHCDKVQCGQFGADMQVRLTNDGPVTFWLQVN